MALYIDLSGSVYCRLVTFLASFSAFQCNKLHVQCYGKVTMTSSLYINKIRKCRRSALLLIKEINSKCRQIKQEFVKVYSETRANMKVQTFLIISSAHQGDEIRLGVH